MMFMKQRCLQKFKSGMIFQRICACIQNPSSWKAKNLFLRKMGLWKEKSLRGQFTATAGFVWDIADYHADWMEPKT